MDSFLYMFHEAFFIFEISRAIWISTVGISARIYAYLSRTGHTSIVNLSDQFLDLSSHCFWLIPFPFLGIFIRFSFFLCCLPGFPGGVGIVVAVAFDDESRIKLPRNTLLEL